MYKVVDTLPSVVAQNFWTAPLTFEISLQYNTLLCSVNASGRKVLRVDERNIAAGIERGGWWFLGVGVQQCYSKAWFSLSLWLSIQHHFILNLFHFVVLRQ